MRRTGLVATFIAATCAPSAAFAYCPGADTTLPDYRPDYYSVSGEFDRAKFVVEAVATNETWLGDDGKPKPLIEPYGPGDKRPWGLAAPYMGAWYDIQVTRTFKGQPPTNLRLFSENSTSRFWLNKGERYLLFITDAAFDEPVLQAMTIDMCGNSAELSDALARQLEDLSAR